MAERQPKAFKNKALYQPLEKLITFRKKQTPPAKIAYSIFSKLKLL